MKLRMILLIAGAAMSAFADGLAGKWSAKIPRPSGEAIDVTYDIKVAEGKISGSVAAHTGDAAITDGTVNGDDVEFVVSAEMNGQARKFKHTGKLSGDTLELKIDFGGQELTVKAKRSS